MFEHQAGIEVTHIALVRLLAMKPQAALHDSTSCVELVWCHVALVKALGCSGLAAPVRAACAECALSIVRSLASPAAGPVHKTLSSEVCYYCSPHIDNCTAKLVLGAIKDCWFHDRIAVGDSTVCCNVQQHARDVLYIPTCLCVGRLSSQAEKIAL